jgi:hypothetical protein
MKTTRIALLALALSGGLAGASSAATSISAGLHIGPSGHARVDLGFFYDDLAPYGNWVERPHYGWVFAPRIVRNNWRPYEYGHWVWTDYGWTWASDEPFGWATYHYGRWYDDPDYGWEWVPGEEWAPSYVSWQEGNDYIGWAPLPPSVDIRAGSFDVSIAPEAYVFVPEQRFLDTRLYDYAVPREQCGGIYRQTRNWTNYRYENNRIFDVGVPVDRIQRAVGRAVPRYQVADLGWDQRHQARFQANQVAMFRPQVERGRRVEPPSARPMARRSVLTAQQFQQSRQFRQDGGQGRMARQQQNTGQAGQAAQGRWARQQQAQQGRLAQQQNAGQAGQGRWVRQRQQQIAQQQVQQRQGGGQGRWARQQQAQQNRQIQQQNAGQGRWARQRQQQIAQQQVQQRQGGEGRAARQQQRQQAQAQQQPQQARQGRWARQQQQQDPNGGGQPQGGGHHRQRPPNGQ